MIATPQEIFDLVNKHETWRCKTVNLIASENAYSPAVKAALQNEMVQRYGDYTGRDLQQRRYKGNKYITQLEELTNLLAQETFRANVVELRPISGHVAGAAVIMGGCRSCDCILEPGRDAGGHREAGKFAISPLILLEVHSLRFDGVQYDFDLEEIEKQIRKFRPKMVIMGSSNFLFPHPLIAIREMLDFYCPESVLVYDGSHVMGFLAAGKFQHPLEEGADLVFGSTHKTLPGPQGGIIFSNRKELIDQISEAVYPGLVTNHHIFRMPALALALLEMKLWGEEYMEKIIANAQALGEALQAEGICCVNRNGVFSQSHTILACVKEYGTGSELATRLESAGIILTGTILPEAWGGQGLRIGVQEITRMGAEPEHMPWLAQIISRVLQNKVNGETLQQKTAELVSLWNILRYTWSN